jgi:hypothetical protein
MQAAERLQKSIRRYGRVTWPSVILRLEKRRKGLFLVKKGRILYKGKTICIGGNSGPGFVSTTPDERVVSFEKAV